ncbi:DNA methylase [Thiohalomonas denitrificans]|nr:DNA methylase [Thiohalomonas denitrificans]
MKTEICITNPKQVKQATGREAWYRYYAGFSGHFARELIASARLSGKATVFDPWNGAGTTTAAAYALGHNSVGLDINPAMIVAAKARSLNAREANSLSPLGDDILRKAISNSYDEMGPADPLSIWFVPNSVKEIRRVESAIQLLLIGNLERLPMTDPENVDALSDLAAFFYTALFKAVRILLEPFIPTNPTWIKFSTRPGNRLRPRCETIHRLFRRQVEEMIDGVRGEAEQPLAAERSLRLAIGSSENIPLSDNEVDFTLTSPPYCTRIDYAVATFPELAVLGFEKEKSFENLRRSMTGTPTVRPSVPKPNREWGKTCNSFLKMVALHPSKASGTYYYKSHVQYFESLFLSLKEIVRVTKHGGRAALVVQDSYYKDLHNDLPLTVVEMLSSQGMVLERRGDFISAKHRAAMHPSARKYRANSRATESVLCFKKL